MPTNNHDNINGTDSDAIIDSAELDELRKKYHPADLETGGVEDTEVFSDDSLEKLISSFRVVYEESVNKLSGFSVGSEEKKEDKKPEQDDVQKAKVNKDSMNDFLSTLRIVYEEPDNDLPAEDEKEEETSSKPAPEHPEQPAESSIASLFKNNEPTAGIAELFKDLDGENPKENSLKRFVKRVFPCKGDGIGESIRKIILIIAILTMLVCGVILLNIYIVSPYFSNRDSQKAVDLKTNSNIAANWSNAENEYPGIVFPTGIQLKFAEFYAINKDFIGWLEIPGAGIDMPIVKGENNSVYLKKTFYGEKSKYGCCFLDSSNNISQLDRNTVIYGHNMSYDDLMFGTLEKYKKIDGFKAAPVISFGTLYKDTKWKIYAVFITNGDNSGDNGYLFNYIFRNLSGDDAFETYISQIDQRKLYTTGVDIQPTDKILTLSTCCYDFKDARLAVVARQVREGENEEIDVSKATEKNNPRYPQAWYTAKGQNNPYKDAEKWFPS